MNHTPSAIPWHSVDGPCGLLKSKAESFIHKRPDFQDYILGRDWPASFNNWLGNPTTLLNFSPSPSSSWNPYATSSAVQGLIPSSTGDWTAIRPLAPDDPDAPPLHVGRIMSNPGGKGELGGSVGESTRFPPARTNASCRSSSCRASLNPPLMDATFDLVPRWVASLIRLLDLESRIELLDLESPIELADDVVPSAATVMGYPRYLGSGGRMWRRSSALLLGNGGLGSTAGFVMFSPCCLMVSPGIILRSNLNFPLPQHPAIQLLWYTWCPPVRINAPDPPSSTAISREDKHHHCSLWPQSLRRERCWSMWRMALGGRWSSSNSHNLLGPKRTAASLVAPSIPWLPTRSRPISGAI